MGIWFFKILKDQCTQNYINQLILVKPLIKIAKEHCTNILKLSRCKWLPFHNVRHTLEVFENVKKIATYEGLSFEEQEPLLIASLFQDTGIAKLYMGHEYIGAANALEFLKMHHYPIEKIEVVIKCILATQIPQKPKSMAEKIMCDADLAYLAGPNAYEKSLALQKEWGLFLGSRQMDEEWKLQHLNFFENHYFFSRYGKSVLEANRIIDITPLEKSAI